MGQRSLTHPPGLRRSGQAPRSSMVSLSLVGGVTLEGADGSLSGPATQRHRLALLALLAAACPRPLTRDKLVGYLWAERDTRRRARIRAPPSSPSFWPGCHSVEKRAPSSRWLVAWRISDTGQLLEGPFPIEAGFAIDSRVRYRVFGAMNLYAISVPYFHGIPWMKRGDPTIQGRLAFSAA